MLPLPLVVACAAGTDPNDGLYPGPAPRLDGGAMDSDPAQTEDTDASSTDGGIETEGDDESGGATDGTEPPIDDDASTGDAPADETTGAMPPPVDPACLPQPTDGACRSCAREHCCPELLSCEDDANCSCAMDCLESGIEPELCYEQCGDSLPALVLAVCGVEPCGTCF